MIHGLFCSHLESSMVTPYLQDYHVLLVDLPENSHSVETPFSFADAIASLVEVIKKHSPTVKVHIVGVSLGGHIALELAHLHLELVNSVFVSGCSSISGSKKWPREHPLVRYALAATVMKTDWLYWWTSNQMGMLKHEELHDEMKKNITVGLVRRGFGGLWR
jgi:pimeloyl-ACP methyl ester carboxylesterase